MTNSGPALDRHPDVDFDPGPMCRPQRMNAQQEGQFERTLDQVCDCTPREDCDARSLTRLLRSSYRSHSSRSLRGATESRLSAR